MRFVLQRNGDVAAIIECFFERAANLLFAGERRNPAFELVVGEARDYFKNFGVLNLAHACWVSLGVSMLNIYERIVRVNRMHRLLEQSLGVFIAVGGE